MPARRSRLVSFLAPAEASTPSSAATAASGMAEASIPDALESDSQVLDGTGQVLDGPRYKRHRVDTDTNVCAEKVRSQAAAARSQA